MKKIIRFVQIFTITAVLSISNAYAQNTYFIYKDIPAMPGMYYEKPKILEFESGKIINIEASINAEIGQIVNFYVHSLKQFGWKKISNRKFERNNQRFEYRIVNSQKHGQIIIFNVIENN